MQIGEKTRRSEKIPIDAKKPVTAYDADGRFVKRRIRKTIPPSRLFSILAVNRRDQTGKYEASRISDSSL